MTHHLIESLTDEQQARMVEYRDKWIKIGLCTDAADRPRAEAAIRTMYRAAGLVEPRKIVWCGSPLSQGLTRAIILDRKLRASVGDRVLASVWDSGYGQHDAGWLSFHEYFREVCALAEQTGKLAGHIEQAKAAGWYLPHQNICWVSERHHILVRDQRGRLHCPTGPAVCFPDGWAIYAYHGVRVPASVIEDRAKATPKLILAEQNVEVRRVMMDLYGHGRFAQDAGARIISRSRKHGAELMALPLPADDPEKVLKAVRLTCPTTGNIYFERVPPDVTDALEALSWRFQIKPKEYQPKWQT